MTAQATPFSNESFAAFGGKCHREMTVPKTTGADAARYTAEYQIAESKRGKRCVKLTLTKQFACFPGDRVQLTAAKLGVSGTFTVISSHCWADSLSSRDDSDTGGVSMWLSEIKRKAEPTGTLPI